MDTIILEYVNFTSKQRKTLEGRAKLFDFPPLDRQFSDISDDEDDNDTLPAEPFLITIPSQHAHGKDQWVQVAKNIARGLTCEAIFDVTSMETLYHTLLALDYFAFVEMTLFLRLGSTMPGHNIHEFLGLVASAFSVQHSYTQKVLNWSLDEFQGKYQNDNCRHYTDFPRYSKLSQIKEPAEFLLELQYLCCEINAELSQQPHGGLHCCITCTDQAHINLSNNDQFQPTECDEEFPALLPCRRLPCCALIVCKSPPSYRNLKCHICSSHLTTYGALDRNKDNIICRTKRNYYRASSGVPFLFNIEPLPVFFPWDRINRMPILRFDDATDAQEYLFPHLPLFKPIGPTPLSKNADLAH